MKVDVEVFRGVFAHIKFEDFRVFDLVLFLYRFLWFQCFGVVMLGHFVDFIFVSIMFRENWFWSFRSAFGHIKFKDFQVFDFASCYYVVLLFWMFWRGHKGALCLFYIYIYIYTLVWIMFRENWFWSFRRVFGHIKFEDFQVQDFALFY